MKKYLVEIKEKKYSVVADTGRLAVLKVLKKLNIQKNIKRATDFYGDIHVFAYFLIDNRKMKTGNTSSYKLV